ncbi:OTU domain-containing protein 3, partial [Haematococcus lacustris]
MNKSDDDEPFDKYMARMAKDGVWAGYMEVIAASQVLQVHLNIYQAGQPRWTVTHCSPQATTLHLSYHDGQ